MSTADAYPFRTLPAPLRFAWRWPQSAQCSSSIASSGSVIDDGSLFLLLGTAVMASAWFAGTGPALAATVIGRARRRVAAGGRRERAGDRDAPRAVRGAGAAPDGAGLRAAPRAPGRRAAGRARPRWRGAKRKSAGRMKDEFLATISHELRTPLNAVLGWLHLLRTGKLDATTSSRGLESIERNVRLQAQLTGDLLDVSKALTGQLRLDSRAVSLVEAVRQAIAAATPAAQAKGVHVTSDAPRDGAAGRARRSGAPPPGRRGICSPTRSSSRRAAAPSGVDARAVRRLRRADRVATAARASIRNSCRASSIGSRRRTRRRRAPPAASASGLSLVRELVELHGGEIRARNRHGSQRRDVHRAVPAAARRDRSRGDAGAAAPVSDVGAARRPARAGPRSGCRRPRAAPDRAAAARRRRCARRPRWPRRSSRSKPGGRTCSSATACRPSTTPTRWSARSRRSRRTAAAAFPRRR